MKNVTDLIHAPHIEVQETLKALQKAGVTLEGLKSIRADHKLAQAIAELIHGETGNHLIRFTLTAALIQHPVDQISAWLDACNRGNFGISLPEFDAIPDPSELTYQDILDGFVGVGLFYGFGGEGDHSDMVLSGKIAWEYAASQCETWKWDSVNFDDPRYLNPRDGVHPRPKGFYWKKIQLGHVYQSKSVREVRNDLPTIDWGMGPEGIQLLAITHPHYVEQMNGRDVPFIDLPDYVVAPGVDGDFYHYYTPHLSFARGDGRLRLGAGSVDNGGSQFGSGSLR